MQLFHFEIMKKTNEISFFGYANNHMITLQTRLEVYSNFIYFFTIITFQMISCSNLRVLYTI